MSLRIRKRSDVKPSVKVDYERLDKMIAESLDENIEVMPDVYASKSSLSWFMTKMFNPEDNIWLMIRRVGNVLSIATFVIVLIGVFV